MGVPLFWKTFKFWFEQDIERIGLSYRHCTCYSVDVVYNVVCCCICRMAVIWAAMLQRYQWNLNQRSRQWNLVYQLPRVHPWHAQGQYKTQKTVNFQLQFVEWSWKVFVAKYWVEKNVLNFSRVNLLYRQRILHHSHIHSVFIAATKLVRSKYVSVPENVKFSKLKTEDIVVNKEIIGMWLELSVWSNNIMTIK